jgi:ATP-binding cassette, subfamily B, bacterial
MPYPFHFQLDHFDCGPACLRMIASYYGKSYSLDFLRENCYITREGVSLLGISQAAEKIGFNTLMVKTKISPLIDESPLPAILHWNHEHFVVLYDVYTKKRPFQKQGKLVFVIADPGHGITKIHEQAFRKCWLSGDSEKGIALLIEPTPKFYGEAGFSNNRKGFRYLLNYLGPFRKELILLSLSMVLSTLIAIAFPYLTKGIVDKGILSKNSRIILLFSLSQLVLFLTSTAIDILKSWITLHMNSKISLNIVSDFLKKLLNLPIRFFDSKSVGDVSQRIADHHRIENFLTGDVMNSFFSILNIIVFSFILLFYSFDIWMIFLVLSCISILWMFKFQKKREQLDYVRFIQSKAIQEKMYEMIVGMQEIKLFASEQSKRLKWEALQQKTYDLTIKSLMLEQYQQTGFNFFNYLKNIVVSFLAAIAVMNGKMTLGVMLSISYIMGQINSPLEQLRRFFKSSQDARLSLDRLQEVHQKMNEDDEVIQDGAALSENQNDSTDLHEDIIFENVSFQYQGPRSPFVINNLSLKFVKGQITAVVGTSGSGKTTLLKLMLGFYKPTQGIIRIGTRRLSQLRPRTWRAQCGTVMQDGYIFYDTITNNIVLDGNEVDMARFEEALSTSNTDEFVSEMPLGYNTKIGSSGIGLSGGQKQRILIARAVYKNPNYIFLDEATSSLDANNESQIMQKLNKFFQGKTVVIVAHRLSTVKNANHIVVLEGGKIVERGKHGQLAEQRGKYFELVRNQLEL